METDNTAQANDKEVWSRETTPESVDPFKSYAGIRVSNDGCEMTLCLGGHCITRTIEEWHEYALFDIESKESAKAFIKELSADKEMP